MTRIGPLIILSGPSGSGKSTIVGQVLQQCRFPLRLAVSATTRKPRVNPQGESEKDGVQYHFWTQDHFEKEIAAHSFLEWAIVHGKHYYGTPKAEVEPFRQQGIGVILDVDVQGAEQIRRHYPEAFSIFLRTSEGVYEKRLRDRGTEDEAAIQRRLQTARAELARVDEFSVQLWNDDLVKTVQEFLRLVENLF